MGLSPTGSADEMFVKGERDWTGADATALLVVLVDSSGQRGMEGVDNAADLHGYTLWAPLSSARVALMPGPGEGSFLMTPEVKSVTCQFGLGLGIPLEAAELNAAVWLRKERWDPGYSPCLLQGNSGEARRQKRRAETPPHGSGSAVFPSADFSAAKLQLALWRGATLQP